MDLKSHIEKLDPGNADHWTSAGLPSVGAVSELAGEAVTRAQIMEAMPGYDREKANAALAGHEEAPAAPTPSPDDVPSTERDGEIGEIMPHTDTQVAEEGLAARPDALGDPDAEEVADVLDMIDRAMTAAQDPRFRRNSELQALVRQWQIQQTAIRDWQRRIDERNDQRNKG